MRSGVTQFKSWRDFQKRLQKINRRRVLLNRLPGFGLCAGGFLILVFLFYTGAWIYARMEERKPPHPKGSEGENIGPVRLAKSDLPTLLGDMNLGPFPVEGGFPLSKGEAKLNVETSLDTALHNYINNLLHRSMTYQAAVVVLRPDNGQILAMANYVNHGGKERENLCLKADFPAASLFKIISAAAAIEEKGYTPERTLVFRGKKSTLYKSQLKQYKGRYTRKTSFRSAFSGSINPIFGKIGIYDLGRELMKEYADRFLFNRAIPFDLPLGMSSIDIPDDDFGLAEIASGFNKTTRISPLHAVLITSAVANNGVMMEPWLISRIKDESERVIYRVAPSGLASPIKENTAKTLKILMEDTVERGTCRRSFFSMRRKKIFKDIVLGAKTGTINDQFDKYKYDWLTAYALPKNGDEGICIAVLAVHGEKLGIRAKDLATHIINYHFTS